MYTLYILFSKDYAKIYIGYTGNLTERLKSHELGKKGWTRKYRPWAIVYSEKFERKAEAASRERQLKSGKGRE